MSKLIIALIFCHLGLLRTIRAAAGDGSVELQISSDGDLQSIELLAEVERDEVLPLTIFTKLIGYQYQKRYQMPEKLVQFELKNGKITRGTKFAPRQPGNEIFLCPKENSAEKCLVPTSFEESEPLQCSSEPTPQWLNMHNQCGGGDMGSGTIFLSVYKVCETHDRVLDFKDISIYEICYNTQLNKVVYARYVIMSPELLSLNLLTRERSVDYPIIISEDVTFPNHPITSDILTVESENSKNQPYQLQQFVSHGDMAFATLRMTTFNNINYEWQHINLTGLWDEIGANIRSTAKKYSTSGEIQFVVNTAIIDRSPTSEDDDQLCNIWMKMAFVMNNNPRLSVPLFTHGIVILMNNFLNENECSDDEQKAIEKHCIENLCIDELINQFTEIGGQIRCCPFTPEILNHFNFEMDVREELRIPNVTVAEDHKTVHFHDSITEEQAGELLREIQLNEILPLILLLDDYDGITLHLPTSIYKIETKDKRIVQGSEFCIPSSGNQLFFCPQEDTDEKCLYPKKFARFQPLQCAKEAVPVIQKISGESGKCGFKNAGTVHEVGYEICPTETHDNKFLLRFYYVCYDEDKKRNLFTHHRIVSSELLFTNLLLRERNMQHFTMTTDDLVSISPFQNLESKPGYILQQLVPSGDLPFASWKQTTYQRINADWQHEKLTSLWNKINGHIRNCIHSFLCFLQRKYSKQENFNPTDFEHTKEVESYIYTGIFHIKYDPEEPADDQMYNMWVKIIRIEAHVNKDLVILMNNFLVKDQSTSTSANSKQNVIRKYCKKNLCLDSIIKAFEKIGGRIRCCPLTHEIAKLFGLQEVKNEKDVMSIPHVTKQF